jgi:hypothetical protein
MEKVVSLFKPFTTIFYLEFFKPRKVLSGAVKLWMNLNIIQIRLKFEFESNSFDRVPVLCQAAPPVSGSPSPIFPPRVWAPARAARPGVAAVGSCRRLGPSLHHIAGPSPPFLHVSASSWTPTPFLLHLGSKHRWPHPPPPFFLSPLRQRSRRARELECFSILPLRGALRHHRTTPKVLLSTPTDEAPLSVLNSPPSSPLPPLFGENGPSTNVSPNSSFSHTFRLSTPL